MERRIRKCFPRGGPTRSLSMLVVAYLFLAQGVQDDPFIICLCQTRRFKKYLFAKV